MSTRASPSQRRSLESPQPKPVLQKLSGLTIGMWKSRAHESLYLLVLPSTFVFVVETGPKPSVPRTSLNSPRLVGLNSLNTSLNSLNTSLSASPILKQFVSASPFSCGQHAEMGVMVFAFEVRFDSVAGVDYQNPLVRQGRLTLEALGVTRREFCSLDALKVWYGVVGGGTCGVCDFRGCSGVSGLSGVSCFPVADAFGIVRPKSATRRSLQFDGEELSEGMGSGGKGAEDEAQGCGDGDAATEASSFAFCVDERGRDGKEEDRYVSEDVATSRVIGEDGEHDGERGSTRKKRSPWSALRLRRNAGRTAGSNVSKSPPSTNNLPRLTIPSKSSSDDNERRLPSADEPTDKESEQAPNSSHAVNKTYVYRTITAEFTSPHVPCVLGAVFKQHTRQSERLLKMYESGLPSWAMFLPSYGMYYRPWMRSITWVFFYLFSVLSLTLGFYDLYKTLPGLQDALAKLVESYQISVWWPILSAYHWIESHAQLRLSILLTYLFGKSELLNMAVTYVFEPARAVVMPMVWVFFAPLRLICSLGGYVLYSPLTFAWTLASRVDMMQAARGGGAGIGVISEAMRQSLVTTMRATNNVWKFIMNMSGGVSRHRLTLSRRAGRNWERLRDAVLIILARVCAEIVRFTVGSEKIQEHIEMTGDTDDIDNVDNVDARNDVSGETDQMDTDADQHSLSFSYAVGHSTNEEEEVKSVLNTTDLHVS